MFGFGKLDAADAYSILRNQLTSWPGWLISCCLIDHPQNARCFNLFDVGFLPNGYLGPGRETWMGWIDWPIEAANFGAPCLCVIARFGCCSLVCFFVLLLVFRLV